MQRGILEAVKSPLSVIAIFAMISEIAMTVTLLNLPSENQKVFIWFVMVFPVLLVALFFIVLYTKPAVLFSPSDYQEDTAYLRSIGSAKGIEELTLRIDQIDETCNTIQKYIDNVVEKTIPDQSEEIIDAEKQRIRELKFIHSLESNSLYAFLNRELNIEHDEIKEIISQSATANNLPEVIAKVTSNEPNALRASNILINFPRVIIDFNHLKETLNKGE